MNIKFNTEDLLTYVNIETLITSEFPNERAEIICNKLKVYLFNLDNQLYIFNKELVIYKKIQEDLFKKDDFIISKITKYIDESIKNLTEQEKLLLKLTHGKLYNKICENSTVIRSLPQIRSQLIKYESPFKPDFEQIHFKNGYFDLRTGEFKNRVAGQCYIRNYINRDFEPSSDEKINEMNKIMKQIYPNEADYQTMLFILGSAITGKATKLQKILFLLGEGSAGKSTIMEIAQKALGCYFETLPDTAFSESSSGKDKCFSTFYDNDSIRIIWTNEPKTSKMDTSIFKKFCEGFIRGVLLYKNGTHDFIHHGLPIFTANEMPNISIDTGVKRRFRAYNHTSLFTEDKTKINEEKNVYLKNEFLLDNIIDANMLNTWIEILVQYAKRWLGGEVIPITENFNLATNEIIEVNDDVKDFVDAKLSIEDIGAEKVQRRRNRIAKNEMLELYKEMYPKKYMTIQLLIPKLRTFKIDYESTIRGKDGVKGCFIGVVEKLTIDDDDDDETIIDKLYPKLKTCDDSNKDDIIKEKNDEIEMLKQKIYEMEQMLLNNKKQSMKEFKQKMKPKSIEDEYSFSDEDIKKEADIIKETIKQQKIINKKLREKEKKKNEKKEVIDLDKVFEDDILKGIFD